MLEISLYAVGEFNNNSRFDDLVKVELRTFVMDPGIVIHVPDALITMHLGDARVDSGATQGHRSEDEQKFS